jgi:hypothetical protein
MRMGMVAWSEIATVEEGTKRAGKRRPQYNAQGKMKTKDFPPDFKTSTLMSVLAGPWFTLLLLSNVGQLPSCL